MDQVHTRAFGYRLGCRVSKKHRLGCQKGSESSRPKKP